MEATGTKRSSISIVGLALGAILTLGLVMVGINWLEAEQTNNSRSQQPVAALHRPTDRGPGHGVASTDAVAPPSSKVGTDRDVATTYLALRAQRTAVARDSADGTAATSEGVATTPSGKDRADRLDALRGRSQ